MTRTAARKGGRYRLSIPPGLLECSVIHVRILDFSVLPFKFENIAKKFEIFGNFLHFNLLRSSYPTVPLYADGYELLASGAFLTSVSVSKKSFLTR